MNAPFAQLFLAISQQLAQQIPTLGTIDQDLGQLKNPTRPPVSWPCALIDFEHFETSNLSQNVQLAQGIVVIRLGYAPHSTAASSAPSPYRQLALGYYELEWQLHQALQGWSPGSEFGALCRTAVTTQKRTDTYRVRELRYSIAFQDLSTKPQQLYTPATLQVQLINHHP